MRPLRPARPAAPVAAALALAITGCGGFAPEPADRAPFRARATAQEDEAFRVAAAALSAEESRRTFDLDLAGEGVQPIWIRVENRTGSPGWFLPIGTDPAYFAPYEVAYMFHRPFASERSRRIDAHLLSTALPLEVPAGGAVEGFVHTHLAEGARWISAYVVGGGRLHDFRFVAHVPGRAWDFERVDFATLYPAGAVRDLDLPGLLAEVERLPCCAAGESGRPEADPLNLVLVGTPDALVFPFVARGWNFTEPLDAGSAWRSVKAFLTGSSYRTSPVSPLRLFGRSQDAALQKPRNDIDRRNHLRVWLAPFTFQGTPVWIGQVSRDIGVRFTTSSWYLTTHQIDPDVDEDRDYLLQDLVMTGHVSRAAFVPGVGAAPASTPRRNLTGDPYFTDGRRLLLFLDPEPGPVDRVRIVGP